MNEEDQTILIKLTAELRSHIFCPSVHTSTVVDFSLSQTLMLSSLCNGRLLDQSLDLTTWAFLVYDMTRWVVLLSLRQNHDMYVEYERHFV